MQLLIELPGSALSPSRDILSSYLSLSLVLSLVTQREDVPAVIGTAANTGLQSDF